MTSQSFKGALRLLGSALSAVLVVVTYIASPAPASASGGHDAAGAAAPLKTWYFAEGTTRPGFTTYLCLQNPGTEVALVDVSYMLGTGEEVQRRYDLLPRSRATLDLANEVPPGNDVSMKVASSEPVVAERPMYFTCGGGVEGGHVVAGAAEPRGVWHFAEGCTRDGFDTYLCILNPSEENANADITYFCEDGRKEERKGVGLPAGARTTVAVHGGGDGLGRHNSTHGDASIEVKALKGAEIVVERPMYFNYGGAWTGGHDVLGAAAPRRTWYFAEGCTRPGFDTYLCISNPGPEKALVDAFFYCGDGADEAREGIEVPARGRKTVKVFETPEGIGRHDSAHGDFSIRLESTNGVPVVAERPVYFSYRPFWNGGHDVMGTEAPRETWYFAEGCTREGFDTYLCVGNPGAEDAVLDIRYACSDGSVMERNNVEVEGGSRLTVGVHEGALGSGRHDDYGGDVSIMVRSTNGVPVVAERPMYFAERWRTMDKTLIANNWGWGEVVTGNQSKNCVALTFDMEMSASNAERLLDILRAKDVKATCFLLGTFPTGNQSTVLRMCSEGHELGNHSVTHSFFTNISYAQATAELAGVESAVVQLTGYSTKPYFRFPGGDRNSGLIGHVNSQGYLSVYWTVDPQDWSGKSGQAVRDIVVSESRNGAIVLLHDRNATVEALPGIIDGLRAKGLNPCTLTEALYPGP